MRRIVVYNADFSNRVEIPFVDALQMQELYNGIGKFQLALAADDYNIAAIEEEGVLYDTKRKISYTIQDVWKDSVKNQIRANGYTTNWLLNKRAVTKRQKVGNVESGIYKVVNDNLRNLFRVSASTAKGLKASSDSLLFGRQLLDSVMPVLSEVEYGNRMLWNDLARQFAFEVYQGRDLTPAGAGIHAVVFSENQGTAKDLIYEKDNSTFKNYFYILGEKADKSEVLIEYGDPNVADRREFFINGKITQGKGESESDFILRAKQKCREEAGKRLQRVKFNVKIDTDELGSRFNLGDKVACVSERLGVSFEARIAGANYTLDRNGEKTDLILGEPSLTALGEAMLQ